MGRTEASGTDRRFAWCSCCGRKRLCDITDPVLCDECRENTQTDANTTRGTAMPESERLGQTDRSASTAHAVNRKRSTPPGARAADVLARLVVEVLDAERDATGVDEWDESDPRCDLYNAAYAWVERDYENVYCYEPNDDEYLDWLNTYDGRNPRA